MDIAGLDESGGTDGLAQGDAAVVGGYLGMMVHLEPMRAQGLDAALQEDAVLEAAAA